MYLGKHLFLGPIFLALSVTGGLLSTPQALTAHFTPQTANNGASISNYACEVPGNRFILFLHICWQTFVLGTTLLGFDSVWCSTFDSSSNHRHLKLPTANNVATTSNLGV